MGAGCAPDNLSLNACSIAFFSTASSLSENRTKNAIGANRATPILKIGSACSVLRLSTRNRKLAASASLAVKDQNGAAGMSFGKTTLYV